MFPISKKSLFFQTSAERLAILSNKKVFGMVIVYNFQKKIHDLHISPPLLQTNLSLQLKAYLNLWKVLYLWIMNKCFIILTNFFQNRLVVVTKSLFYVQPVLQL